MNPTYRWCFECAAFNPIGEDKYKGECCRYAPRPRLVSESDNSECWPGWPMVMWDFGCCDSVPRDKESP